MSWLYTLVVASLFVSADLDVPQAGLFDNAPNSQVVRSVPKDETERFEQSYPLSAKGRVSVSNVNGSIELVAWDRNEVKLEATKIADTKESLGDVELKIDARPEHFSVDAEYKQWNWRDRGQQRGRYNVQVQFRLSVPRTAVLNEIETVNGSVNAANFVNTTKISAVNGSVTATNLRGNASLSTVNGTVNADFDRIEGGTKIGLSTVNGRINLSLPSDANALIKADSLNGNITNGFGLPVRKGEYVGRDLHGRLGSGEAEIKLDSVNGPLAINKKDDGRPVSPATNLLSGEGAAERDEQSREHRANAAKVRAETRRAVNEARRVQAQAIRDAQRELANVELPDLKDIKIDVDPKILEKQIHAGLKAQEKAFADMQEAMFFSSTPRVERKANSFAVEGAPRVRIDAPNCNVRIRGWDKPEVKYVLTEFRDLRGSDRISVSETQTKNEVVLAVKGGDAGMLTVQTPRLEVYVPRKSDLNVKTDGEIRLEGVTGDLELLGSDDSIDVRGSGGRLTVVNADGVVRLVDFTGALDAKTVDGEMYLDGSFDSINASSIDGRYILSLPATLDADVSAAGGSLSVQDLASGKEISKNNWRFGKGSSKYVFRSNGGSVELRNRDSLVAER